MSMYAWLNSKEILSMCKFDTHTQRDVLPHAIGVEVMPFRQTRREKKYNVILKIKAGRLSATPGLHDTISSGLIV